MANPLAGSLFYARLGNAFTRPLWSLLGPPKGFAILTTTGRKTGKPRRQSVRAIREGDRIVVVAMMGERAQWLKNVRANPKVTVRLRGETIAGLTHAVRDEAERKWAAGVYCRTFFPSDYVDYATYHWGFPSRRKIETAHRCWFEEGAPVVIDVGPNKT
jgi:deazaflavin-dependent oxidoreductase (nitroreductase family)